MYSSQKEKVMQLKNKKKFELPALKSNISQHEVLQLWLIKWIGLFLTDRSQRVRIGQVYSHPVTPNEGIPQGTKLAPLLFAILVNNYFCREWRYRIKYVDDTLVFESILDVRLATFHLSPQILTPTLPCVTCGLMRKNVKIWLSIFWSINPLL